MNNISIVKYCLAVSTYLSMVGLALAENVFYETDFEGGILPTGSPNPVWTLPSTVDNAVGPGNMFEVVSNISHSGKYSLRFNYQGRNNICNNCGGKLTQQMNGFDSDSIFVDKNGADLTLEPFLAKPGRYVYNTSDGWSKWEVTAIGSENSLNDKLTLTRVGDGVTAGSTNLIQGNDDMSIQRVCGVDGSIGNNDFTRRSDCNQAINYFSNDISQQPGESIYRRVYVQIDQNASVVTLPYHQKLRYWTDSNNRSVYLIVRRLLNDSTIFPYVEGLKGMGGPGYVQPEGVYMTPGVWYYIEEEFKAESSAGAKDGEYRLWFAESGKENNTPVIDITGLELAPVKTTSLWGNHQHHEDSSRYWYIDDLSIANVRIGPNASSGVNISPPKAPTSIK